ncbi:MAG: hypothetical protein WCJ35_27325, partial [Planctomycetota bacterium]
MTAPRDPRDRLPPYLRRYCPDQQQCRLWSAKCRSVLYEWPARFGKGCALAWSVLDWTACLFLISTVGLVLFAVLLPSVTLWGLAIAGLVVFGWRARRWRELDRIGRSFVVCGNLASVAALTLAIGGLSDKPGDETRNPGTSSAASDMDTLHNPLPQSTATPGAPRFRYTVTDLGTLGGLRSEAFGINNAGQVVGNADPAHGDFHAFLWQTGRGMQDLGTLGGSISNANGINDSGQVVGSARRAVDDNGGEFGRPFLWTSRHGMQDLGSMGLAFNSASAVNNAGEVVGTCKGLSGNLARSFLWRAGTGMQDLASLGGDTARGARVTDIVANGINNTGQVVGAASGGGPHVFAFLWQFGKGMRHLGTLGGLDSNAVGINDRGQVVGGAETAGAECHAFMWTADGGMKDLGSLGGDGNEANGINNTGQVVGGPAFHRSLLGDKHSNHPAFLYVNGKMADLNRMIDPASGWHLITATSINDSGQIVGTGKNKAGQSHAFLLTPVPSSQSTAQTPTGVAPGVAPGSGLKYQISLLQVASTISMFAASASAIVNATAKRSIPPSIAPIKVPKVVVYHNSMNNVLVSANGRPIGPTATITDVGKLAVEQYQAVYPRVVVKAVTRRVAKEGIMYGAKEVLKTQKNG